MIAHAFFNAPSAVALFFPPHFLLSSFSRFARLRMEGMRRGVGMLEHGDFVVVTFFSPPLVVVLGICCCGGG